MTAILIIDDDVALLAALAAQLEDAAFSVIKSSDLVHAERMYAEQRPDLVVLEVQTGAGKGWDLLSKIAADVPVLVLSFAGREEDVLRGFAAGAIDYVSKPYRSAELLARIRVRLAPVLARAVSAPLPRPVASVPNSPPPARPAPPSADPATTDIFMSEAEELALLRAPQAPVAAAVAHADDPPQGLGARLRAERLRRQYTLVQVENELKIRMSYLQAMEDEKFTLLPRGPVALEMVRSYAGHLGMPVNEVLSEFKQNFYIEPVAPPPALGGPRMPRSIPRWVIMLTAIILALALAVGAILVLDPDFFITLPERVQPLLPVWEDAQGYAENSR